MRLFYNTSLFILALFVFMPKVFGQDAFENLQTLKENEWSSYMAMQTASESLNTDFNIDVTFYHISINVDIDNKKINGSVYVELTPTINNLNQVRLNLHNSMTVTSVSEDATSVSATTNTITLQLAQSFDIGETVKLRIDYQGTPVSPNGTKGFRFTTNSYGVPVVATLCTPYLSHYWWPCKDGTTDKADKTYIDITIPTKTYEGFDLIAVSNGVLSETTTSTSTKTFKWRHNYPCVPYYIMVAVSNYDTIKKTYNKNGHNFPLDYYVFPSEKSSAADGVANMGTAFDTFIYYFGDYPFKSEKYGMTQIGFYGGIENQTNAIMNSLSSSWFITSIHELAHMWFGCSITCDDWHHVWINEGFATYAEALYYEKNVNKAGYHNYMSNLRYVDGGTIYLQDDSNPFGVFNNIAYNKGAWVLHMLRGVLGDNVFFNCLKTYAQNGQFQYKNASTEDFKVHCESISGKDLTDFFNQWIYDAYYPIYKYNFYSDVSEGKTGLTLVQTQDSQGRRSVFKMPVTVKFTFSDGTTSTTVVTNDQKSQTFYFDHTKTVTNVAIDPENWILQTNSRDNTITVPTAPSNKKLITAFTVPGQISSVIDQTAKTILITMPTGTNRTALTPTIAISTSATVSPASGASQDFTSPITYRVTAQNGTTNDYTVTVKNQISSEKQITSFTIANQVSSTMDQTAKTVLVLMPYGTATTYFAPTISVSASATISPSSGSNRNFLNPRTYTVTAEDGSTQAYIVTVTILKNDEKQITAFNIAGQVSSAIDETAKTIAVTIPFGMVKTSLSPTINVSTAASVNPASGVAQDFSSNKIYTVTAQDGSTQDYTVTVSNIKNTETEITSFNIAGQVSSTIDQAAKTIAVTMPYGTDKTNLSPTISLSAAASVSPASNSTQDLSAAKTYTVTAEDGSTQDYTVTVTNLKNSEKQIISFTITGQISSTIDQTAKTVLVIMPYGTIKTSLAPTISVSEAATINPLSGATRNFTNTRSYTVTAQDGSTQVYAVTVTNLKNSEKQITAFTIAGQVTSSIDQTAKTIDVTMPFGTDKTSLTPSISLSTGASVSPTSGSAQDFTSVKTYRVTAEDGSFQDYTVTVTNLQNTEKQITAFTIAGQVSSSIDQTAKTITVTMPFATVKTALVPTINVSAAATVSPASGVAQDFTSAKIYRVTAEDGSFQDYSVAVTNLMNDVKLITAFTISGQVSSTIDQTTKTITVTMPFATVKTALLPIVSISAAATVSPASGAAQDFTSAKTYRVTAEDGSFQDYTVTVNNLKNTEKQITAFTIAGQVSSTIDQTAKTVTVTMPFATVKTALAPTISVSAAATVSPASGAAQDFTSAKTYRVTAEDGSFQDYTVTVTNLKNTEKQITAFTIAGQISSSIDQTAKTITVTMPFATVKTALVPTISVSAAATVSPASGSAQDFSSAKTYRVTAEDGSFQDYAVTVSNLQNTEKQITAFTIAGQVSSTIDQTAKTIAVTMPFATVNTALVPTISVSAAATVSPTSGAAQDFTSVKTYRVTAEDGSFQDYAVTVSNLKNTEKQITAFTIAGQVSSTIDQTAKTVTVTMPFATVKTALAPTISVSAAATVSPTSGAAQDFASAKTFRVTAEDGSFHDYTVTVTNLENTQKQITAFTIAGQVSSTIDQTAKTIAVTMPFATVKTALVPTISVSAAATVSPASGAVQDFTSAKTYRVTAEDRSFQDYAVTVSNLQNTEKQITAFTITGQVSSTIDQTAKTIAVTMPFATVKTALVPTISVSAAATVLPASGAVQDFTSAKTYRVTAEDGSFQDYAVTVSNLQNTEKQITAFTITGQVSSTIDQTVKTVTVTMPFATVKTALVPTISVSAAATISPTSGAAQDFSSAKTYWVTAEDGSFHDYTVTVTNLENTQKQITAFTIAGQVSSTIDQTAKTVAVTMPFATVKTALVPTISVSAAASVSPNSGVAQDFTSGKTYRVTAEDGSFQDYAVTVTNLKNTEKQITAFTIAGQVSSTIDQTAKTVTVTMPFATVKTALVPTISVSAAASVSPNSGVAQDFTSAKTYKVTAEDGSFQDYTVTVNNLKNTEKQITAFTIAGQVSSTIDQTAKTVAVTMPFATVNTALVPTISVSAAATVSPASGAAQDFTSGKTYRVTAEDGSFQDYTVTVTNLKNTEKQITAFTIAGQVSSTIDQTAKTITVTMPFATVKTALAPTISVSAAATVSPTSGAAQDFTSGKTYRVTAEDGSFQDYTVTVSNLKNTEKQITAFTIAGQVSSAIDPTAKTVTVTMPFATVKTALVPTISVSAAASISPNSGVAQDFSSDKTYRVTAEDGSFQDYAVTVTNLKNTEKQITAFTIAGQVSSSIDQTARTITVTMPFATVKTALVPTISVSAAATVSPASGSAQDFSSAKTYRVTAEDGSFQDYTVTVTNLENTQKQITAFTIAGQVSSTIDQTAKTIAVTMPFATAKTALVPTISVSAEASVSPNSGVAQDFTSAKTYRVTAEDGSFQDYAVTVSNLKNTEKQITAFTIAGQVSSTIDQTAKTITVTMPFATVKTALLPTISMSAAATVSPASGAAQDFTSAKSYKVTAEDGSFQNYAVTVTNLKNTEKQITAFTIAGQVSSTIDQTAKTVTVTMPFATIKTALVPTISVSAAASVSPNSGVAQDFSSAKTYRVTADDGSFQDYSVTVSILQNTEKQITAFTIAGQVSSSIDQTAKTIVVTMPFATVKTALVPTISVSAAATVSPTSGAAQDFTSAKIYRVTAEDGSFQDYTVTVTNLKNTEKQITAFTIAGQVSSAIDQTAKTITVTMPFETVKTALVPTISVSAAATVLPGSNVAQDFTSAKTYRVMAEDGSTEDYTVTVNNVKNTQKQITAFNIEGQVSASINQTLRTVAIIMPTGTDRRSLVPTIGISAAATVSPSSNSAQDFSSDKTYRITAEDGSWQDYTVTVRNVMNTKKLITSFSIAGEVSSSIDQNARSIAIVMPMGTDRSALSPSISISVGATVSPTSGTLQDFTSPVTYVVMAEDGSTQDYTVTVQNVKSDENDILMFSIEGQLNATEIDPILHTVKMLMPATSDISSLTPFISISPMASVSPTSETTVDFSHEVIYAVTSESGKTQQWKVTVNKDVGTGISQPIGLELMAYPNPTNNRIQINSNIAIEQITVYKLNGAQMAIIPYDHEKSIHLDLLSYGKGIFILKIETDTQQQTFIRVVVE